MIEKAIFSILKDDNSLTALISDRIYPAFVVQKSPVPYIRYQNISTRPTQTFDGLSKLRIKDFQVDSIASDLKEAKDIAEAVKNALIGFNGPKNDVRISNIFLESEQDLNYEEDLNLLGVLQVFTVVFENI